jgi:hypothetical protein
MYNDNDEYKEVKAYIRQITFQNSIVKQEHHYHYIYTWKKYCNPNFETE